MPGPISVAPCEYCQLYATVYGEPGRPQNWALSKKQSIPGVPVSHAWRVRFHGLICFATWPFLCWVSLLPPFIVPGSPNISLLSPYISNSHPTYFVGNITPWSSGRRVSDQISIGSTPRSAVKILPGQRCERGMQHFIIVASLKVLQHYRTLWTPFMLISFLSLVDICVWGTS
jgi:hypothetical protein